MLVLIYDMFWNWTQAKGNWPRIFFKCLYFDRIFLDAKKLKTLRVNHNQLISLPPDVDTMYIEEILLHNNKLASLPPQLLNKANK